MKLEEIIQKFIDFPKMMTNGAGALSKKLNCDREDVYKARERAREVLHGKEKEECQQEVHTLKEQLIKINNEKGTLESTVETSFEPRNDIELAALHKVDLTKYKIANYWTKQKSNGKFTSSVFATLKKANEFSASDFSSFLINYTPTPVNITVNQNLPGEDSTKHDVEISIADFHLDRLTLQNNNIESRKEEYLTVLKALIKNSYSTYNINKFIFVIGNDFFNSDNYQGGTTNLTPQDNSVTWNKAYEEGYDLLVKAISLLSKFSEQVEVILVNGNHDRTKSFFLAHALEIFFKDNGNIWFNRTTENTKSTTAGNTFIGYHHGNCKIDDLPLIFATSENTSVSFGTSKFREVHTADKHFYMAKEIKGVRIQQIPSMVNPDRWSTDGNYINNIRAGIAFIYHPTKGKVGELEERI